MHESKCDGKRMTKATVSDCEENEKKINYYFLTVE